MAYTTINKSGDYFNTKLYTGTGSSNAITGVGFQPDLTWIKNRDVAYWHNWYDAVRGTNKSIASNANNAEETRTNFFNSFDSDGFTVNSTDQNVNASSENFVAWNWKANGTGSSNTDGSITSTVSANTTAGFSIVKWTGTGANATVGHGLGVAPSMIIIKNLTTASQNWQVYHKSNGATRSLELNTTSARFNKANGYNNTDPTSSVFSIGSDGDVNASSASIIAYCFADVQGYSKFGSYTGNGNADGTFVYTGFKPTWVMFKNRDGTNSWEIRDDKRSYNLNGDTLWANTSDAGSVGEGIDFLSNGFKCRASGAGQNGSATYVYAAFGQPIISNSGVVATAR